MASSIPWSDILKIAVPSAAAVGGAVIGSRGANAAAQTQTQSATEALALQREIFNREQQNLAPYLRAGNLSLTQLLKGLGIRDTAASPASLNQTGNAGGNGNFTSSLSGNLRGSSGSRTLKTGLSRAVTGAGIGSIVPGVGTAIGAGIGAAAGGISSMFGRGRKEADSLVPIQNQVSGEVDRITKAIEAAKQNGTLTQQDLQTAISTVQGLQNEFGQVAGQYGKAGPGGVDTLAKYFNPLVQGWQNDLQGLPVGNAQQDAPIDSTSQPDGSSTPGGDGMGFGDLNASFDPTKDPRYNPQFEAMNHPFTQADYQQDPGYDFRLAEGQKALERSGSAKGMTLSGPGVKALTRYGQDFGSNEFQNAYQRFAGERSYGTGEYQRAFDRFSNDRNTRFSQLAAVAGIGQTANGQSNSAGADFGANAGNLITDAGSANAQAQIQRAGLFGGAVNTGATTLRDVLNMRKSGYNAGNV